MKTTLQSTARRFGTSIVLAATIVALTATAAFADYDTTPNAPDEVEGKVNEVLGFGMYLVGAAGIAGLLICAVIMMVGKDHGRGGRDGIDRLWYVIGGCALAATAVPIAAFFM